MATGKSGNKYGLIKGQRISNFDNAVPGVVSFL
jgi:hypothetical protein